MLTGGYAESNALKAQLACLWHLEALKSLVYDYDWI